MKRLLTAIAVLIALFAIRLPCMAQPTALDQYSIRRWNEQNGALGRDLRKVYQAPDGYIWIGSLTGVGRFDGFEFELFDLRKLVGARTNVVTSILGSSDGTIWLGTYGSGLVRFSDGTFRLFTQNDGLGSATITGLALRPGGGVWVGARAGLAYADEHGIHPVKIPGGRRRNDIGSVFTDQDGSLWAGTFDGLLHWKDGSWIRHGIDEGLDPRFVVHELLRGTDGVLQGEHDGKLVRYEGGRFAPDARAQKVSSIKSLYQDPAGDLWIGGWNDRGLARLHEGIVDWLPLGVGSANIVSSISADQEDNIWLGSGEGLVQLRVPRYSSLSVGGTLQGSQVLDSTQDSNGDPWFSTADRRIIRVRDGKLTAFGPFPSRVSTVRPCASGGLFLGFENGDILQFENGRGRKLISGVEVGGEDPNSMVPDGPDALWIGSYAGLFHVSRVKESWKGHRVRGLISDKVTSMARGRDNSLWIGTDRGLNHLLNNGAMEAYTTKNGLSGSYVRALFVTDSNDIWAATVFGMTRIRHGVLKAFSTKEGMLAPDCMDAKTDRRGNLWIFRGTDGIDRITADDLAAYDSGRTDRIHPRHFGSAEGVDRPRGVNPQFDRHGVLWMDTLGRLLSLDPANLKDERPSPKVAISSLSVDGSPVMSPHARLNVSAGPKRIDIHYSALSFYSPERVRFKYRLEGHETEWTVVGGTQRVASYTDLRPGQYVFQLLAANGDGMWSRVAATAAFRVSPFFYQTRLFWAAMAILAASALWLIFQLRMRIVRRQFEAVLFERTEERNRIARELHDTVLQGFSAALIHLEAVANRMLEDPAGAKQRLGEVLTRTEQYLEEARSSIIELRAPGAHTSQLTDRLCEAVKQQAGKAGLLSTCNVTGTHLPASEATATTVLRIATEAVNNVIRHANATEIRLSIMFHARTVTIQVEDNGCGFDLSALPAVKAKHLGITGMRERAGQIGGSLEIWSKAGEGTRLRLIAPLQQIRTSRISRGEASLSAAPRGLRPSDHLRSAYEEHDSHAP